MLLVRRAIGPRGPVATPLLLGAVLTLAVLAGLDSPLLVVVPESGLAAAIPPLPARRTPLATTHAPTKAFT